MYACSGSQQQAAAGSGRKANANQPVGSAASACRAEGRESGPHQPANFQLLKQATADGIPRTPNASTGSRVMDWKCMVDLVIDTDLESIPLSFIAAYVRVNENLYSPQC